MFAWLMSRLQLRMQRGDVSAALAHADSTLRPRQYASFVAIKDLIRSPLALWGGSVRRWVIPGLRVCVIERSYFRATSFVVFGSAETIEDLARIFHRAIATGIPAEQDLESRTVSLTLKRGNRAQRVLVGQLLWGVLSQDPVPDWRGDMQ